MSDSDEPIRIDAAGATWVATFAGVGTVRIEPDGKLSVDVFAGPEPEQRSRALLWGWGEPLSFLRRGFWLTDAVVSDSAGDGLLVTGHVRETSSMLRALTQEGWLVLADSLTPVRWTDEVLWAHPRRAPVLSATRRADEWGLKSVQVRTLSDSAEVPLPRSVTPASIRAVLRLNVHSRGKPTGIRLLRGTERLKLAAGLPKFGPGTDSAPDPAQAMADDFRLSSWPMADLWVGERPMTEHAGEVIRWWKSLAV